jgi:ketol-acid reductoisomerase
MASRRAPQALRSSLAQLSKSPIANGARFTPALLARASAPSVSRSAVALPLQQTRGMKTIDFAGTKEVVYGLCLPVF